MSESEMVLPGRDTIEAYVSEAGFICLKQSDPLGDQPSIIAMLPHDVPTVVSWLQKLASGLPVPGEA
jgi:hypothetical protein